MEQNMFYFNYTGTGRLRKAMRLQESAQHRRARRPPRVHADTSTRAPAASAQSGAGPPARLRPCGPETKQNGEKYFASSLSAQEFQPHAKAL